MSGFQIRMCLSHKNIIFQCFVYMHAHIWTNIQQWVPGANKREKLLSLAYNSALGVPQRLVYVSYEKVKSLVFQATASLC